MLLTEKQLRVRDAKRNIGEELLSSVREMKTGSGKKTVITSSADNANLPDYLPESLRQTKDKQSLIARIANDTKNTHAARDSVVAN